MHKLKALGRKETRVTKRLSFKDFGRKKKVTASQKSISSKHSTGIGQHSISFTIDVFKSSKLQTQIRDILSTSSLCKF